MNLGWDMWDMGNPWTGMWPVRPLTLECRPMHQRSSKRGTVCKPMQWIASFFFWSIGYDIVLGCWIRVLCCIFFILWYLQSTISMVCMGCHNIPSTAAVVWGASIYYLSPCNDHRCDVSRGRNWRIPLVLTNLGLETTRKRAQDPPSIV